MWWNFRIASPTLEEKRKSIDHQGQRWVWRVMAEFILIGDSFIKMDRRI